MGESPSCSLPISMLGQSSPWVPLWAQARCQRAYAALAPGSPLLVMAVMVAGSLSRLPVRLVMLIW